MVKFDSYIDIATRNNYKVFLQPRELNIVGYRSKNSRLNHFDDTLAVYSIDDNREINEEFFKITTLPGEPYLKNPMNKKGTAILKEGQYYEAYELGAFKGYTALRQVRPVTVYRDNNRDAVFDKKNEDTGYFGLHIHRAGLMSKIVGISSAGCQVFQKREDFDWFIRVCETSRQRYFTYTLVEL